MAKWREPTEIELWFAQLRPGDEVIHVADTEHEYVRPVQRRTNRAVTVDGWDFGSDGEEASSRLNRGRIRPVTDADRAMLRAQQRLLDAVRALPQLAEGQGNLVVKWTTAQLDRMSQYVERAEKVQYERPQHGTHATSVRPGTGGSDGPG